MKATITLLSAVLISVSMISGCSKNDEENGSAQSAGTAKSGTDGTTSSNVSKVISVQKNEGKQVAEFSWTNEQGMVTSFSEFSKDNVVLINFWATWCGPCVRELPELVALNDEYKGKNIKIIGISVDRDGDVLGLVRNFAAKSNIKYPIVIDNGELEKVFGGIRGIPTSFFVNKKGEIVKHMIGLQSKETFQAALMDADRM